MKYTFQEVSDLTPEKFVEIFERAFAESGLNQADLIRRNPKLNSAMLSRINKHRQAPKPDKRYEIFKALDLIAENEGGDGVVQGDGDLWQQLFLDERRRYDELFREYKELAATVAQVLKKEDAGDPEGLGRPASEK